MKRVWLACTMIITLGISSCIDNDKDLFKEEPEKEINPSDFSTIQTVKMEINYTNSNTRTPFAIYDRNPLIIEDNTVSLREDIHALEMAWTDENGQFTGEVELPSYVSEVFVISQAFYAQMLMQGKINNGILKVTDADDESVTRAGKYSSPVSYDANRFNKLNWLTKLGGFDNQKGTIEYAYRGNDPNLTLSSTEMESLRTTVYSVLNTLGNCPEEYRTSTDLYIGEPNTAVVLTALGGWTCWNSSLGYYYYRADTPPANLNDATVYAIFPNTQTTWNNGISYQSSPRGVTEGTAVQLKYFGDPEHPEGINFPAGYRIGFVLACNAWNTYFSGFSSHNQTTGFYSCSTKGFSSKGANNIDTHTAMFKDKKTGNIAIAFEDFKDDQNFTDVIFSLKSNPEITNVPEVDADNNTTFSKQGIYAFEDQWPKAGDYDMNDVLVQYIYQKTFNIYNEILKETFSFKPLVNSFQAVFNNGFGFTLKEAGSITTSDSIRSNDTEAFGITTFEQSGNAILLTNGVKTSPNATYKVVATYDKALKKTKDTAVEAFIFRPSPNTGDLRLEVHCTMEKPTSLADYSLFGESEDCSVPENGIFYVSDKDNIYPFAFYLANASIADIAPLLEQANESTPISQLYPQFIDWAKNGTHSDWYKK